jgi:hypothetical protein
MNAPVTMTMDTRGLEAAIHFVVPETHRTVAEQCVTSMGMILQNAQNWTPAVDIGRMDAELDEPAASASLARLGFTAGDEIVMARANPNSKYNAMTGNRFAIKLPSGIRDFARAYGSENAVQMFLQAVIEPIRERMRMARHSSGHFLQAGFKMAIEFCVTSPLFKNRYRSRSLYANPNPLNVLDARKLGNAMMTVPDAPSFTIIAQNNVGQDGNEVLDAKHRDALIAYASGPLQDAIDAEKDVQIAELNRRLKLKFDKANKMMAAP